MPKTVTLVRVKADKDGDRLCCEECVFGTSSDNCGEVYTRSRVKQHPFYCGATYYWALKTAAKKRKGEAE